MDGLWDCTKTMVFCMTTGILFTISPRRLLVAFIIDLLAYLTREMI